MPSFVTPDGRTLAYARRGEGRPLLCHPGGPGLSGAYLEDLGGLDRSRALIALDPRGTGASDAPSAATSYALGDYVADVELLRAHLDLDRVDLLGHSHGSLVALGYAAAHPERVARMVLVATCARFHEQQMEAMHAAMQARAGEPWFEDACAALKAEQEGRFGDDAQLGRLVARELPFYFARYGDAERAFVARVVAHAVHGAALQHFNEHEFLTFDLRPSLGEIRAHTLVVAGEHDFILGPDACREVADAIADARLAVIADVGHMPWIERSGEFRSLVEGFLGG